MSHGRKIYAYKIVDCASGNRESTANSNQLLNLPECCKFCSYQTHQLADQQRIAQMVAVAASAGAEVVIPLCTCSNTDEVANLEVRRQASKI